MKSELPNLPSLKFTKPSTRAHNYSTSQMKPSHHKRYISCNIGSIVSQSIISKMPITINSAIFQDSTSTDSLKPGIALHQIHSTISKNPTRSHSCIDKNKEYAALPHLQKQLITKEKAFFHKIRGCITKLTKYNIYLNKKQQRQEVLDLKQQKFEYRVNFLEIMGLYKSWISLYTAFGMSSILKTYIKNRQKLRGRSVKLLCWLQQLSKVIGRIQMIRQNKRLARASKKIRIYLMPLMRIWAMAKKDKNLQILTNFFEDQQSLSTFFKIISRWKAKIFFIQRSMKRLLFYRLTLYESLCRKWNKAEYHILSRQNSKKSARRAGIMITNIVKDTEGLSSIPTEVKVHFLRGRIKEAGREYFRRIKSYANQYNSVHLTNIENQLDPEYVPISYPEKPDKPKLLSMFSQEVFSAMISEALRDRSLWIKIVKSQKKLYNNLQSK